jgi:hypothetical protein
MTSHEEFLDQRTLSKIIGVAPSTLEKWRWLGIGPPYVKIGAKAVRYPREALSFWLASLHKGGEPARLSSRKERNDA